MGRRRKEDAEEIIRDRVGEVLNLDKCPECREHPDCFSQMNGRCTALKECGGQDCVFYKPMESAVAENQEIYEKLVRDRRYDLLGMYKKSYAALGVEDPEFCDSEGIRSELKSFEAADFEKHAEQSEQTAGTAARAGD